MTDPCSVESTETVSFYPPPWPWQRKKMAEEFWRRRRSCEYGCGVNCKGLRKE